MYYYFNATNYAAVLENSDRYCMGKLWPLLYGKTLTAAVWENCDRCCMGKLWPLLYVKTLTAAVWENSDHCCMWKLWPLLYGKTLTAAICENSDRCCMGKLWPLLYVKTLTAAVWENSAAILYACACLLVKHSCVSFIIRWQNHCQNSTLNINSCSKHIVLVLQNMQMQWKIWPNIFVDECLQRK